VALVLALPGPAALQALADTGDSTRVTDPKQHATVKPGGYPYREKCEYVLKELDLKPGDVVADVGAGDGWWSRRMAGCVGPTGTIHAAEVEQKLVDEMKKKLADLPQVKPYLCKPDHTLLPDGSCDLIFLSQVYHHLPKENRVEYLGRLRKVLKPTGRLCVIEKYSEIATKGKDHGMQLSRVLDEAERSGWVPVRCELITGTGHFLAIFVSKDLFPPPEPEEKPAPQRKPPAEKKMAS
jgi:ubiquinone/menaquinone biosynthesis C-methylase UbiE